FAGTESFSRPPTGFPAHQKFLARTKSFSRPRKVFPAHRKFLVRTESFSRAPRVSPAHRKFLPHTESFSRTPKVSPAHRKFLPRPSDARASLIISNRADSGARPSWRLCSTKSACDCVLVRIHLQCLNQS